MVPSQTPDTAAGRRAKIRILLRTDEIRSQAHLQEHLQQLGFTVTQATLSRDLDELGAVKVKDQTDQPRYVLPEAHHLVANPTYFRNRLAKVAGDVLISVEAIGQLVVAKTTIAGAQLLASALDNCEIELVAGTIAGDDTVLVIARNETQAREVQHLLADLAEGKLA